MSELIILEHLRLLLHTRLDAIRKDEGGYSTESVLVTALLAGLAIAAVAIISVKVIAKANAISTD